MFKKYYRMSGLLMGLFYFCIILLVLVGILTYKNMEDLSESTDMVTHTYIVNVELEQIISYLKDAETGQRGFIITNDSSHLKPYFSGRESINNTFAELKELVQKDTNQEKNLRNLSRLIDMRIASLDKSPVYAKRFGFENQRFKDNFSYGKDLMDSIRLNVNNMIDYEQKQLQERQQDYQANVKRMPLFLFSVLLFSILIIIASYRKMTRDLRELKSNNEQLAIMLESANQSEIVSQHGNWVWHMDTDTYSFSDNLYRLLGEDPQAFEANFENFMKFVHTEDVEHLKEEVEKMKHEDIMPYTHYRVQQADGKERHLKSYGKTVVNNDGKKRLLVTTRDITDGIESFKILEERNFELERNIKELSAFNHVASHDLQEPLRKIQTFLSRFNEKETDNLSDTGKKYLERINLAAARMRLLIDDLLQYSRTNKADKVLEDTNLNELLENAKLELEELIEENRVIIQSEPLPTIKVIPFQMQQLFINIIGNAIKYKSLERTPVIHISYAKVNANNEPFISKHKDTQYHKLQFVDNGIGFDNVYAAQIFVLFNRLHKKDEYSGTGIGLSICKKIVENHKGFIFAEGTPDVGATFTVFLPIH